MKYGSKQHERIQRAKDELKQLQEDAMALHDDTTPWGPGYVTERERYKALGRAEGIRDAIGILTYMECELVDDQP